jgi:hypothetical protein
VAHFLDNDRRTALVPHDLPLISTFETASRSPVKFDDVSDFVVDRILPLACCQIQFSQAVSSFAQLVTGLLPFLGFRVLLLLFGDIRHA